MARKIVSERAQAELLTLCRRRCCICFGLDRDVTVKTGQIAHLDRNAANSDLDNLAFLCLSHHDQYDSRARQSKGFKIDEVKAYRRELYEFFYSQLGSQIMVSAPLLVRPETFPFSVSDLAGNFRAALDRLLPEFELPGDELFVGDWASNYDASTGFPVWCRGSFTGSVDPEFAFFALHRTERRYRVVLLTEEIDGSPYLIPLEDSAGSPVGRFVSTVPRGKLPVSRSVWKHGGPKSLDLAHEAIEVGTFESASCVYHWDEISSSFHQQWISD